MHLKKGIVKARGKTIEIVDLPGIYSLGVTNEDEKVTKQFLIEERPDIVINVVDASRLERNLYLTLQLLELDIPMVIALNQVDLAADLGILVDTDELSELLAYL
ncbi:FeoB small GTPase domain-containing protein [Methanosarcina barkeri]|uniref:FeoB small GTPase domain-containing protein n=1 Tax=Methanosarcina barkeri TaxID=2208 RepID=UPI000AAD007A|nr:FeoB small GTPase domain-containing protein [Methanosarcina barkeri]